MSKALPTRLSFKGLADTAATLGGALRQPTVFNKPSETFDEARKRSIRVYRHIAKSLPAILQIYEITNVRPADGLKRIRKEFEATKDMRQPLLIDFLRMKAETELHEAWACFKSDTHIAHIVSPPEPGFIEKIPQVAPNQTQFLSGFLRGINK